MSFGTPTFGDPAYTMDVSFAAPPADEPFALVTITNVSHASAETDMDTLAQLIVDLVAGSTDLIITNPTKTTPSVQVISPT